ncbi:hypothetical protein D3C73_1458220 [compost metagenome]
MAALLQRLMDESVIESADPLALAQLINGGLTESAFWIADADAASGSQRLDQALQALDLLLRGLLRHA